MMILASTPSRLALLAAAFGLAACGADTDDANEPVDAEVISMADESSDGVPDTSDTLDSDVGTDGMTASDSPMPQAGAGAEPMLSLDGDMTADFMHADGMTVGSAAVLDGPNGIILRVDLSGFAEGWHGIHLHQVGDCSDNVEGFQASGSHVNPAGNDHGLLNEAGYEAADMPNIYAGRDGRATAAFFNPGLRATEESAGDGAVLMDDDGFAVVVHENPDDHMTQPIGGAGSRMACAAFTG